jgi:hypothetical protein
MAKWTVAYKNRLPDDSFLLIEPGGQLDETGRTVPRSLRHFPYRGMDGRIDRAHAKNALGRIPQSKIHGFDRMRQRMMQSHLRRMLGLGFGRKNKTLRRSIEHLRAAA